MTIVEALVSILKRAQNPMSTNELLAAIEKERLYSFRTVQPARVLRTELRRHSVNAPEKVRTRSAAFTQVGPDLYVLASSELLPKVGAS